MNNTQRPPRRRTRHISAKRRSKTGGATFGEAIRLPVWLWWLLGIFYVLGFAYFLVIATLAFVLPSRGCQC